MFYDPGETVSTKLRNQRTRQKLALAHERAKVEAEDEREREERRLAAGRRIEPELRRLAAVSEERQQKAFRTNPASNDPASVRQLRQILKNVEVTEVMLRRNDRSMILTDVQNKRRKEEMERAKEAEARRLSRKQ
jgi:hypothetical protein